MGIFIESYYNMRRIYEQRLFGWAETARPSFFWVWMGKALANTAGFCQPPRSVSLREEFGMLEYHYEVPNLSPRRYQIQVPVNYVSPLVNDGPGAWFRIFHDCGEPLPVVISLLQLCRFI